MEEVPPPLACSVCVPHHHYPRPMGLSMWPTERNMYLAEDRILCFEIVTKKNEGWMYVPSCQISTAV